MTMPNTGKTTRQIVWAIVVLFITTLVSVTLLALFADERTATLMVTTIVGQLAGLAAVLVNLRVTSQAAEDTHRLTNGLLDAKVRAGVAEVVHDELLDPEYVEAGGAERDQLRRHVGDDTENDTAP